MVCHFTSGHYLKQTAAPEPHFSYVSEQVLHQHYGLKLAS